MKPYFVEIQPEHISGDGWTANAWFSRQEDYRKFDFVSKMLFPTHVRAATRGGAEYAAAQWARGFVHSSTDVLESALQIKDGTKRKPTP